MDLLRERLKARGAHCAVLCGGLFGGGDGGGNSSSTSTTNTTNVDQRQAVQDGIAVNGTGNNISYSVNSSDAVKALASMGADVIKNSGGAVVDLFKENTKTWDATTQASVKLVDKLIDGVSEGFALSSKAIDSFQPEANKNTDALKWAAIAAAAVGAAYVLREHK